VTTSFTVNGRTVTPVDDRTSLLDVLRDDLGLTSVKDGCAPQGQCGCCTVLVDGVPRVSCVTPARRVEGREILTLEGLDPADRDKWAAAFTACGASQCGFCTPGIIVRLEGLRRKARAPISGGGDAGESGADDDQPSVEAVDGALRAHLCRCTGWQTIHEAAAIGWSQGVPDPSPDRDLEAAGRRAEIEGRASQVVGQQVALGAAGFADDDAPSGALVAMRGHDGSWVVAESVAEARQAAGTIQGRRTTIDPRPPIAVPEGDWVACLQTGWVEPGYLETDSSWCEPGGEPSSPLANGGAFGGKVDTEVGAIARRLADEHGRPVRVLYTREDVTRLGPKRPPVAGGLRADGTGVLVVARTPGLADIIEAHAPSLEVREVGVVGPPTSIAFRAAGWLEASVLLSALGEVPTSVVSPEGATATAAVTPNGLEVNVSCGDPLDAVVLRSYCIGAAHMALGWVTSEALSVDEDGTVLDLTIRSFGVVRAADMPHVEVVIDVDDAGPPVNGSDAVMAAVAGALWADLGRPGLLPHPAMPAWSDR
jgi:xanthine dehydrogenase small subunit